MKYYCIKLREVRLEQGLTQKKLAQLIKCSVNKISKLERCLIPVNIEDLYILSFALNVQIGYLTGQEAKKELYNAYSEYDKNFDNLFNRITLE